MGNKQKRAERQTDASQPSKPKSSNVDFVMPPPLPDEQQAEKTDAPKYDDLIELPEFSKDARLSDKFTVFVMNGGDKLLLPLKKVSVSSVLRGCFSTTSVELTYVNPSEQHPLECNFNVPIEETQTMTEFEAEIDEKIIKTRVIDKETAKEKYDDAVAGGKAAVMAQRKTHKTEEDIIVKLGNLLPGKTAKIKATIVGKLEVVGGSYSYQIPTAFYPDYSRCGIDEDAFEYEFEYKVEFNANNPISSLHIPEGARETMKAKDRQ